MKVGIGSDHRGFKLKEEAINYLQMWGHEVLDYGTLTEESCDYPKYAFQVARAVATKTVDRGILICGTGIGMSIAANKVKGVRAARCVNWEDASASRKHGNANVLCIGEDVDLWGVMDTWLATDFEGDRHARRIEQITQIEGVM